MVSLIVADAWKNFPLVALIGLAALQAVPRDIQAAAVVDGAGAFARFRFVLWPYLAGPLMVALVLRSVGGSAPGHHPDDVKDLERLNSAQNQGDHQGASKIRPNSMLVALGGCEPQVKGHVAANLNVGNDRARLIDVLTQLLPFIGYPRALNGFRMVDEVTTSASGAGNSAARDHNS